MSIEGITNATLDGIALHRLARAMYYQDESAVETIQSLLDEEPHGEFIAIISLSNLIMILAAKYHAAIHPHIPWTEAAAEEIINEIAVDVINTSQECPDE